MKYPLLLCLIMLCCLLLIQTTLDVRAESELQAIRVITYQDLNNNGVVDEGENKLPHISVTIENLWNGEIANGITDNNGLALFTDRSDGLWIVRNQCFKNVYMIAEGLMIEMRLLIGSSCQYLPVIDN